MPTTFQALLPKCSYADNVTAPSLANYLLKLGIALKDSASTPATPTATTAYLYEKIDSILSYLRQLQSEELFAFPITFFHLPGNELITVCDSHSEVLNISDKDALNAFDFLNNLEQVIYFFICFILNVKTEFSSAKQFNFLESTLFPIIPKAYEN